MFCWIVSPCSVESSPTCCMIFCVGAFGTNNKKLQLPAWCNKCGSKLFTFFFVVNATMKHVYRSCLFVCEPFVCVVRRRHRSTFHMENRNVQYLVPVFSDPISFLSDFLASESENLFLQLHILSLFSKTINGTRYGRKHRIGSEIPMYQSTGNSDIPISIVRSKAT